MGCYAIVLAGGAGRRMGMAENKVFLSLRGIPAIVRAVAPFTALCAGVVVVAQAGEVELMRTVLERYGLQNFVPVVVPGGEDRQASVANGLSALPKDADVVLVHDGARPLVTEEVIRRVIDSVKEHGSGVAAVPVTDTVKRADPDGRVRETLDRRTLFAMQTPQGFSVEALRNAHALAKVESYVSTDDAALLEKAGKTVYLCLGDPENVKLTTPMDLMLAELILQRRAESEA